MNETAKELYPDWEEGYGPGDYQPIVNSFGTVAVQVDDSDYQGDSRVLYHDENRFGWLQFGWGSCSGCDALQACDTWSDLQGLVDDLRSQVKWFDSKDEAISFFENHSWDTDYSCRSDEQKDFIQKSLVYMRGLTNESSATDGGNPPPGVSA